MGMEVTAMADNNGGGGVSLYSEEEDDDDAFDAAILELQLEIVRRNTEETIRLERDTTRDTD